MSKKISKVSLTKGQIAGQVFIYMMAAIVIGGIAIIGYNAITGIGQKVCQTERATFKTDIEGWIEQYNGHDSVTPMTIKAPCDYDAICFIDATKMGNVDPNKCSNPIVANSIKDNIFVVSNKVTIPIGYSDLVRLNSSDQEGCLCIKQRNRNFYLIFHGQGSATEIVSG